MKNKLSQKDIVLKQMRATGSVSRNWCLSQYISRLSGYILDFHKEGMNIEGKWVDGDYVYTLLNKPKEVKRYFVGGVEIAPPKITW
jgi:hypothetical protein